VAFENQENMEVNKAWLLENGHLYGTPEFKQKADLFIDLSKTINSKKEELSLKEKLNSNPDKTSPEWIADATRFLEISKITEKDNTSYAGALARGAIQGASFETADEVKSGALAAIDLLVNNPANASFGELYDIRFDKEQKLLNSYKENKGGAYLTGQVGGSLATIPLGGTLGKFGQYAFGVGGTSATLGGTALKVGTAGAVQGGLTGFGQGTDLESRVNSAVLTAGISGGLSSTLGAGGYKLSEIILNSSKGIVNRAAGITGDKQYDKLSLTQAVEPQVRTIVQRAKVARDVAYSNWRRELDDAVLDLEQTTGSKIGRNLDEGAAGYGVGGAPRVLDTTNLRVLFKQRWVEDAGPEKKYIQAILNADTKVSFDTYRLLKKDAWEAQKMLPNTMKGKVAEGLKTIEKQEYDSLNKMFPTKNLGTKRKQLDNAVKASSKGITLTDQLVIPLATGKPLDPTFVAKFLPNNTANTYASFSQLQSSIRSWAKEAKVSSKTIDSIYEPLRATAIRDLINDPKLLEKFVNKQSVDELTLVRHYKELLTPSQFKFIQTLTPKNTTGVAKRLDGLIDYHIANKGIALSGLSAGAVGVGAGAVGLASPLAVSAGLAVLAGYFVSPVAIRGIANKPQLLALASRIIKGSEKETTKELSKLTENLGRAALKAGIITNKEAAEMVNNMINAKGQE